MVLRDYNGRPISEAEYLARGTEPLENIWFWRERLYVIYTYIAFWGADHEKQHVMWEEKSFIPDSLNNIAMELFRINIVEPFFWFYNQQYPILAWLKWLYQLDVAEENQCDFQDPATPIMEGLIDLHHSIMFIIVFIFCFVLWIFAQIILSFNESKYTIYEFKSFIWFDLLVVDYIKIVNFTHGVLIEIVWTLIPTFILIIIAVPSFALLYSMDEVIDPDLTIKIIGNQWYWTYEICEYDNFNSNEQRFGEFEFDSYMIPTEELSLGQFRLLEVDNELVVPVQTHIRLIITASDVLHAWAVPSLGIKMDAVPGRLNQVSMYIKREGLFYGQCSELCGVNHGFMPIVVKAVNLTDYLLWLYSLEGLDPFEV